MKETNESPDISPAETEYEAYRRQKHEKMNAPEALIADAVEKATGSKIATTERIIAGESNEVYSVVTESGDEVIVRISHSGKDRFEKEKWAFKRCKEAGVPTPEMLYVGDAVVEEKRLGICVETKLPGIGLDQIEGLRDPENAERLSQLLFKVGETLADLHTIVVDGFGKLDGHWKGRFHSVPELIASDVGIGEATIVGMLADRPEDIALVHEAHAILVDEAKQYPYAEPRLIHNDPSPKHVLFEGDEISGLIDMEGAGGGDPLSELARWDLKYGKKYPLGPLLKGYASKDPKILEGEFDRKLNFWKIYKALTNLRYNLEAKKPPSSIKKSLTGLKGAVEYFG